MDKKKKLGFGLMRLPVLDRYDPGSVDIELLKQMVDVFLERGFTYFDTAWMYCAFQSENAIKKALVERYPREAYTLTTKLHAGFLKTKEDRDAIFQKQLEKTGVEFFDYYWLHDVNSESLEVYERLDCFAWLQEKQEQGLVQHIGFSFHDTADVLDKVLTEHPEFEYVQIQLNYLDWDSDAIQSRKCYEVATSHHVPVLVMEPVKGGTLAKLPESAQALLKSYAPEASIPSWAIRFAASLDNVCMVLSGMSDMEQMLDNTGYMAKLQPLNEEERALIRKTVSIINNSIAVPCTGCEYCMNGCPKHIPIPRYFALYNADLQETEAKTWRPQGTYYNNLTLTHGKASDCIACGKCEKVCPQHLPIRQYLKDVAAYFEH